MSRSYLSIAWLLTAAAGGMTSPVRSARQVDHSAFVGRMVSMVGSAAVGWHAGRCNAVFGLLWRASAGGRSTRDAEAAPPLCSLEVAGECQPSSRAGPQPVRRCHRQCRRAEVNAKGRLPLAAPPIVPIRARLDHGLMSKLAWPLAVLAIALTLAVGMVVTSLMLRRDHSSAAGAAAAPTAGTARAAASGGHRPVFSCTVKPGYDGHETYQVQVAGSSPYNGTVKVAFRDNQGDIFPPTHIPGTSTAGSNTNWHSVPAADIGASAEPSECTALAARVRP